MAYIYLASPYTDKNPLVRQTRYNQVAQTVVQLLNKNIFVYSPIVHCHEIAKRYSLPKDFKFWQNYNYAMLRQAAALHIVKLEGWEDSEGVKSEVRYALEHGIPVAHLPYPLEK